MSSFEEIRSERLKKLTSLREKVGDVYPASVNRDASIFEILNNFSKFSKKKKASFVVGRIMAIRAHGGAAFFDVYDGSGKIQGYLKKDEVGENIFNLFQETIDVGDFIEIRGLFFVTKKKEKTIKIKDWKIIAKSLRPLPEKWHGLQDVEERFRKRYLDILMNEEAKNRFLIRSRIISEIRNYYNSNDYIEVEVPILQQLAGGATARPFIAHHNALNTDFYLCIARELYLKKLLIGGLNKVYEIGKVFRNEGIDVTHNPEFTMLESQEAYADAKSQMVFIEKLFKFLIKKIFKTSKLEHDGKTIDFSKKFAVVSYYDLLKRYALIIDIEKISKNDIALKAKQFGIKVEDHEAREKIIDNIYKKICLPKLIQPTFIVDYPVEFSPFAKKIFNKPELIDRFQLVISGMELVNAFSEINDPIDQKERFLEQDKKRKAGEAEISPNDENYIEAMEYGMPPNGGIGIGIDRLIMLLTNAHNIKEAILFPTLKPKE